MCLFFFVHNDHTHAPTSGVKTHVLFLYICNAEVAAAGWRERTKKRGERVWKYDEVLYE